MPLFLKFPERKEKMSEAMDFWGFKISDVITMKYDELAPKVIAASGMSVVEVIKEVTRRRVDSENDDEISACSRIISACLDGPDVIELMRRRNGQ